MHPIEAESYRILAERVDLSHLDRGRRAVVERVIHASADLDYADTMRFDDGAVDAAVAALRAGAPIVTDVEMVRAAVPGALCYLPADAADESPQDSSAGRFGSTFRARQQTWRHPEGADGHEEPTRSALGMREAARRHRARAVVVVGCAPTALVEAVELEWEPAVIVGLPVGFVGAAESKALARESWHLTITNVGEKGGSAVAAAAVNALRRIADAG